MGEEEGEQHMRQDPDASAESSRLRNSTFARSMYWMGVATLAYTLIAILYSAWPVALLKPEWLQRMVEVIRDSFIYFLVGLVLVAGSPLVDTQSITLAKRASLFRRLAGWVAIGYLLLIPVQIYAGVKLLRVAKQNQTTTLEQARGAARQIEASTTWAELRQAWGEIPGRKPNLPQSISRPFGEVKDGLVDFLNSRLNTLQTRVDRQLAEVWQKWLVRTIANTLQVLAIFVVFAALARKSAKHPTLLQSLLDRKSKHTMFGVPAKQFSKKRSLINRLFKKNALDKQKKLWR